MDSKNQRNILLLLILLLGLFSFMMVNRSRNLNNKLQVAIKLFKVLLININIYFIYSNFIRKNILGRLGVLI